MNPQTNGECGTMSNVNFGQVQTPSNTYDPDIMGGWGIRPRHYQLNISAQQEVLPRVSVEVGYSQRWFPEFTTTDNRAVTPADYDPFSITAPSDPRLARGRELRDQRPDEHLERGVREDGQLHHAVPELRRLDELLARRRRERQRADGDRHRPAGRDEHGTPGDRTPAT